MWVFYNEIEKKPVEKESYFVISYVLVEWLLLYCVFVDDVDVNIEEFGVTFFFDDG